MLWSDMACFVSDRYNIQIDWEQEFFYCPFCDNPIYNKDWDIDDFTDSDEECFCPICEISY